MPKITSLFFLIFIFLFLRLYEIEKTVNFSADQGLSLAKALEIYKTGKLTLIGPPSSLSSIIKREFYYGPATYYLLIPPIIFGGEPLNASYYLIFLNLIALVILYYVVSKKLNRKIGFLAGLFFATYPQLITYSRFVWNPNFLLLVSSILLFLLFHFNKNRNLIYFILLGFCLGIALQFHYQVVLLIILTFIWLVIKRIKIFQFTFVILGFLIGFSPLIIFEFRHNFYNLKTLLLIFEMGTDKVLNSLPFYYFLCLIPFLCVLIGLLFQRLINLNKIIGFLLIFAYLGWSFKEVISFTKQAPGMPFGWNYVGQKQAAKIIIEQDKKNYNIANLLSGDTRAQDMRYLLKIRGKPPMDVTTYPQADWLFVLSRYDKGRTLNDPVWETSSFRPAEFVAQWPIQNGINLFLFEKSKKINREKT